MTPAVLELLADRCADIAVPAFGGQGWTYGDGEHPSKADLRKMVLGLLERTIEHGTERRGYVETRCGRFVVQLHFDDHDRPELLVRLELGALHHDDVPLPAVTP